MAKRNRLQQKVVVVKVVFLLQKDEDAKEGKVWDYFND